jgi:hypothetical protein
VQADLADSTYALVESSLTKEVHAAFRLRKVIVGTEWVVGCFQDGCIVPFQQTKPLQGVLISCVNLPAEEGEEIQRLVEANGGIYLDDPTIRSATHLISGYPAPSDLPTKVFVIHDYPLPPRLQVNAHVVSRLWLEEMIDPDAPMTDPKAAYPPKPRAEEDAIRARWRRDRAAPLSSRRCLAISSPISNDASTRTTSCEARLSH